MKTNVKSTFELHFKMFADTQMQETKTTFGNDELIFLSAPTHGAVLCAISCGLLSIGDQP